MLTFFILIWQFYRVMQVLNLFLALLLSSFSYENMKKGQQQEQVQVDDDDDDDDSDEEAEEREVKDNQIEAAFERLGRWATFVAAHVSLLTRSWQTALTTNAEAKQEEDAVKVTATSDLTPAVKTSSPPLLDDCDATHVSSYHALLLRCSTFLPGPRPL